MNGSEIRKQLTADLNRDYLAYLRSMPSAHDINQKPGSERAPQHGSEPLKSKEKDILAAGGARFGDIHSGHAVAIASNQRQRLMREISDMIQESLILEEVSKRLSVSIETVQALIAKEAPELFAFEAPHQILLFPRWQFTDQGTLPHLTELLKQIGKEVAPFTINRFMISKNTDLPLGKACLSPRDWLASGRDPEEVLMLASDL
ncbi:hypothetical protein ABIE59_003506 [Marinobacter sp. MBR-99]|jgi:hypothetical protein|uniref:hypothetical protein n=1 Tax=Marinobacter sp. MBR-99 TaxID=3156461 RepID=UPI0033956913